MAKSKFLIKRTVLKTAHGHEVNKWCGSCIFKEIFDGVRICTKLNHQVEIDDICLEYEMDDKIAAL